MNDSVTGSVTVYATSSVNSSLIAYVTVSVNGSLLSYVTGSVTGSVIRSDHQTNECLGLLGFGLEGSLQAKFRGDQSKKNHPV